MVSTQAQYYYKDIILTNETNRQMHFLKLNKVLTVSATGFDQMGLKDPGFSELQQVLNNPNTLKISTTANSPSVSVLILNFDGENRLMQSTDSSKDVMSKTTYVYDNAGRISEIKNISSDSGQTISLTEIHKWTYNEKGRPLKMLRIVDNSDTTEIRFTLDENGNVIDERPFKKIVGGEMIYYYYDDMNRLTDIVRYHKKIKKLMPDYLFEYDDNDRVIQKITTLSNLSLGYLIWRYAFDNKGLKTKEALFNKEKVMTGKIEYSYTFAQ
jgi:hypothetical protein